MCLLVSERIHPLRIGLMKKGHWCSAVDFPTGWIWTLRGVILCSFLPIISTKGRVTARVFSGSCLVYWSTSQEIWGISFGGTERRSGSSFPMQAINRGHSCSLATLLLSLVARFLFIGDNHLGGWSWIGAASVLSVPHEESWSESKASRFMHAWRHLNPGSSCDWVWI